MYFRIKETLEPCESRPKDAYVAVLTSEEWLESNAGFDMGIELEVNARDADSTKAEVNYYSLTGTFSIPDRDDISAPDAHFAGGKCPALSAFCMIFSNRSFTGIRKSWSAMKQSSTISNTLS